jgi:hypothetical protein
MESKLNSSLNSHNKVVINPEYATLLYDSHASSKALCDILRSTHKKTYKEEFHNCALHKYYLGDQICRVRFKRYKLRMRQMREAHFRMLVEKT